jgi:hypothetical protein
VLHLDVYQVMIGCCWMQAEGTLGERDEEKSSEMRLLGSVPSVVLMEPP